MRGTPDKPCPTTPHSSPQVPTVYIAVSIMRKRPGKGPEAVPSSYPFPAVREGRTPTSSALGRGGHARAASQRCAEEAHVSSSCEGNDIQGQNSAAPEAGAPSGPQLEASKGAAPAGTPGPRAACGRPVSRVLSCQGRFTGCPVLPRSQAWAIISLGGMLPCRSSGLPGAQGVRAAPRLLAGIAPAWPCSRWGLPGRRHCCRRRWSLTPPFHPDPRRA